MDATTFAERYDAIISEPRMRALYGDSGYFNTGYWPAGTTELRAACDRLVDEIAAPIQRDPAVVIDAGNGLGSGTRRLAARFPDALVIGANLSLGQLAQAKLRSAVVMDAAQISIASASVDAVVAVESPQHFDTRAAFFAEAFRVLRPGGVLTLSDMLFRDAKPIGPWMLPPANQVESLDAYIALLHAAGFDDVTVRDETAMTWTPFCAEMRRVFRGAEESLRAIEQSVSHYLLASARKPRESASMQNAVVNSSEPHHGVSG